MTIIGVVLGVGTFVAVLGITSTANSQISATFNAFSATQVVVTSAHDDQGLAVAEIQADAEHKVAVVAGVVCAAARTEYFNQTTVSRFAPGVAVASRATKVVAVSDGYPRTVGLHIAAGRMFSGVLDPRRVVVLSAPVARALGIGRGRLGSTVFVHRTAFTVIGIFDRNPRDPSAQGGVLIPLVAARRAFGESQGAEPPELLVRTRVGAAAVVARQASVAIDALHPEHYEAAALAEPHVIRGRVTRDLQHLFVILSGICLAIGAFSIANSSLMGVLERRAEIGLRRALGARPVHIALQFLLEAVLLGLMGGTIGNGVGLLAVLGASLAEHWTAVVAPWTALVAPALGAGAGFVAGIYPAVQAARVEPLEALRR